MAGALRPVVVLMALASVLFVLDGILDGAYPGAPGWIGGPAHYGLGVLAYVFAIVNAGIAFVIARGSERTLVGRIALSAFFLVERPLTAFALGDKTPEAIAVHLVRDARDVVTSLLERGWLSAGREGADDARLALGAHPRFWVEPGREDAFRTVSDARRCAWAWRRYVTAARAVPERTVTVRYEDLVADPATVAEPVAEVLGVATGPLAEAFGKVHDRSAGRWRRDLSAEQVADVEAEAGELLRELGYPLGQGSG